MSFQPLNVNSVQDLYGVLEQYSVNTESWQKTPQALFQEIKDGECILGIQDEKLMRRVDVVRVKCFHSNAEGENFQLIEDQQVFNDGTKRQRGFEFVAEKRKPKESTKEAALRGLEEELQVSGDDISISECPAENKNLSLPSSPTYVGIASCYTTSVFSCNIPDKHYKPSYTEVQPDKQTHFSWKKI